MIAVREVKEKKLQHYATNRSHDSNAVILYDGGRTAYSINLRACFRFSRERFPLCATATDLSVLMIRKLYITRDGHDNAPASQNTITAINASTTPRPKPWSQAIKDPRGSLEI